MGNPHPKHKFTADNQPTKRPSRKGVRNLKTVIREVFNTCIKFTDIGGKPKKFTIDQAGVVAIAKKMLKGDVPAFKALAERLEGMPKQDATVTLKETRDLENLTNEQVQDIIRKHESDG